MPRKPKNNDSESYEESDAGEDRACVGDEQEEQDDEEIKDTDEREEDEQSGGEDDDFLDPVWEWGK